jgi:hypothetical protein
MDRPDTTAIPTDISITFKGGRIVNSTAPDEVLGDSFIQSTKIDAIIISNSDKVYIKFHRSNAPISFRINGDRSTTLAFEHDLVNELSAGKTWYNFKYYERIVQLFTLSLLLVQVCLRFR